MAYYDNYLMDTVSQVVMGVEATPALLHQETVAARRMIERVEKLGLGRRTWEPIRPIGVGSFWRGW
jgi:hypothetical protein